MPTVIIVSQLCDELKRMQKSLWRCIKHKLLFYSLHFGVNVCARCHYYSFKNVSIKRISFVISSLSTLSAMFPSRVCSLIRFLPCSAGFAVSVCGRIYSECWVWWNLFLTSLIRLSDWLISSLSHPYCGMVRQLLVRTLEASLTFWQFGRKHVRRAATGGHFLGLWQCSSVSSLHKRADTGRVAGLMPVYSPVQVSLCNSPFLIHSWDCAGRHRKPSCDCMCGCGIVKESD